MDKTVIRVCTQAALSQFAIVIVNNFYVFHSTLYSVIYHFIFYTVKAEKCFVGCHCQWILVGGMWFRKPKL